MDGRPGLDGRYEDFFSFSDVHIYLNSLFLFFRPGLPGTNGQAGLPGLPGAKVNFIDYRLLSFLLSYFYIGSTR